MLNTTRHSEAMFHGNKLLKGVL